MPGKDRGSAADNFQGEQELQQQNNILGHDPTKI
jgi:hypothetical protein